MYRTVLSRVPLHRAPVRPPGLAAVQTVGQMPVEAKSCHPYGNYAFMQPTNSDERQRGSAPPLLERDQALQETKEAADKTVENNNKMSKQT